jgi:hypothetical protein
MNDTVLVFTSKSFERILEEGGTSSWRLDRNHARQYAFAVCTRNAKSDWVEGPEVHRSAFLVGKVSDVVPSPKHKGRYLIQFSEYAQVNVPNMWQGDRNPVRYTSLQQLGIDPSTLKWAPLPAPSKALNSTPRANTINADSPLTMAEAKKGLALTFGVLPEAIEITIRG